MRIAALLLLAALTACSSFREGYRTMRNDELEGQKAPEMDLSGVAWVNGSAEDLKDAEWTVLVFFKPD